MRDFLNKVKLQKYSFFWILIFILLLIKSAILLTSLYKSDYTTIIAYSLFACMPIILLISFSFLITNKTSLYYLIFLNFFISLIFIIDIVYLRAFGKLISIFMIISKGVLLDLNKSIFSLIKISDFAFVFDIPILIYMINYNKILIQRKLLLFFVSFLSSVIIIIIQFIQLEDSKMLGNNRLYPMLMSPIGYHIFDIYRFNYEKGKIMNNNEILAIDNWLQENTRLNSPDENYQGLEGIAKDKNLIVIQFESLENFVINKFYNNQEITPNINKLLQNSLFFNNIYEQVKEGNSSDAEFMFNTSIYPISNGSTFLRFGENKYISLPYILSSNDYTSIAVHGDDKEFWNRDRVFPALGFDDYVHQDVFEYKEKEGMGISDESLFLQSYKELEMLNNPYYLYIITLTSHMPFELLERNKYLDMPNNDYSSNYLQSIHYTDKVFGEFYKKLNDNGYLENSIIIIYGDHEGIHKYYNTYLPENNNKIPFIVHIPGVKNMIVNKIGGQVDMMPTLLYLMGINQDNIIKNLMGKNLLNSGAGNVLLQNGEVFGSNVDINHLTQASYIADLVIKGNYFKNKCIILN